MTDARSSAQSFVEEQPYSKIMKGDYKVREIIIEEKECAVTLRVQEETDPKVIGGYIVTANHYEFGDMSFDSLSEVINKDGVKVTGNYEEVRMFLKYLNHNLCISQKTLKDVLYKFDQLHRRHKSEELAQESLSLVETQVKSSKRSRDSSSDSDSEISASSPKRQTSPISPKSPPVRSSNAFSFISGKEKTVDPSISANPSGSDSLTPHEQELLDSLLTACRGNVSHLLIVKEAINKQIIIDQQLPLRISASGQ